MASNVWVGQRLIPQSVAVSLLNEKLGDGISWSRFLDEDRRFKRRLRPPILKYVKEGGRCWYERDDVLRFIAERKKA